MYFYFLGILNFFKIISMVLNIFYIFYYTTYSLLTYYLDNRIYIIIQVTVLFLKIKNV